MSFAIGLLGRAAVELAAATVNPTDIGFRAGRQTTAQLTELGALPPYIPGMELTGVVDAVGEGTDLAPVVDATGYSIT